MLTVADIVEWFTNNSKLENANDENSKKLLADTTGALSSKYTDEDGNVVSGLTVYTTGARWYTSLTTYGNDNAAINASYIYGTDKPMEIGEGRKGLLCYPIYMKVEGAKAGDIITVDAINWYVANEIGFVSVDDVDSEKIAQNKVVPNEGAEAQVKKIREEGTDNKTMASLSFYAPTDGDYYIYSADSARGNMGIYRVTKETVDTVPVSGKITFADGTKAPAADELAAEETDPSLIFTDDATGEEVTAAIKAATEGDATTYSYEIAAAPETGDDADASYIYNKHSYTISLKEDSAYKFAAGTELKLDVDAVKEDSDGKEKLEPVKRDLTLESAAEKVTISGALTVVDDADNTVAAVLNALTLTFKPVVEDPQVTAVKAELTKTDAGVTYTAALEPGVDYTAVIEGEGIKDYELTDADAVDVCISESETDYDFDFVLKERYKVTVDFGEITEAELAKSGSVIVFTDKEDDYYVYEFPLSATAATPAGNVLSSVFSSVLAKVNADKADGAGRSASDIILRDGTYKVALKNSGDYVLNAATEVTVKGADAALSVPVVLVYDILEWNFGSAEWTGMVKDKTTVDSWKGLVFTGVTNEKKAHAQMQSGSSIKIPVMADKALTVRVSYYYQADARFEDEAEASLSTQDKKTDASHTADYKHAADAALINEGYVTLTASGSTYITAINIIYDKDEPGPAPGGEEYEYPELDTSKIDVWDFGAEELDKTKYNNLLKTTILTGWDLKNASGTNLRYNADPDGTLVYRAKQSGKERLYSKAGEAPYTDKGTLSFLEEGKETATAEYYKGSLYINSPGAGYWFEIQAEAGDIITLAATFNTNPATYVFFKPDSDSIVKKDDNYVFFEPGSDSGVKIDDWAGKVPADAQQFTTGTDKTIATLGTFYAPEKGTYVICTNNTPAEKLWVARVTREHTNTVEVKGTVTLPAAGVSDGAKLVFTCNESGEVRTAPITVEGNTASYSVKLKDQHSYTLSVSDSAYVVKTGAALELAKGAGGEAASYTHAVALEAVDRVTMSGSITGIDAKDLSKVEIIFRKPDDKVYVPEIEFKDNKAAYEVKLEKGVEYTIITKKINDYRLKPQTGNEETAKITADTTRNLVYEMKPTYAVSLSFKDGEADIAQTLKTLGAKIKFTNLGLREGCADDIDYSYTFAVGDEVKLRDGVYNVEVTDSDIYKQKLTSDLVVDGDAVNKTIEFDSTPVTKWDFTNKDNYVITAADGKLMVGDAVKNPCSGLTYSGTGTWKYHSTGYGSNLKDLVISVPVSGTGKVVVGVGYTWDITSGTVTNSTTTDGGTKSIDIPYAATDSKVDITVGASTTTYIKTIEVVEAGMAYKEKITVGTGKDYKTINEALDAVRSMDRSGANNTIKPVTIEIEPGNYEEMLVIDTENVTLKNASATPSIELKNKGVDIDANAVRITSYYGHGYNYYSMGNDCKWSEEVLKINKENGYASMANPGSGAQAQGSYWNATVVITASNVSAQGIIFENSFNQYVSKKASEDVIVNNGGGKDGATPRAELKTVGDTTVQQKEYVERAAALAIGNGYKQISFDNCKFIGRQDTLDGGTDVTAAFYNCSIYGGTDYIMGPMTAVFAKCELVFNTNDQTEKGEKDDVGYITAAQTAAGTRGYLMYNCHVTSTKPGVDTASEHTSKPGLLGRPWKADSGEAVFYNTVIDAADSYWIDKYGASLIQAAGWTHTLNGESKYSQEYNTFEYAKDVDNSTKRVKWATVLEEPVLVDLVEGDNKPISVDSFLGTWNPFEGKDMTIVMPKEEDKVDNKPQDPNVQSFTYVLDINEEYPEITTKTDLEQSGAKEGGTDKFFTLYYKNEGSGNPSRIDIDSGDSLMDFSDGYSSNKSINLQGTAKVTGGKDGKPSAAVKFETTSAATVKVYWRSSSGGGRTVAILDSAEQKLFTGEDSVDGNTHHIDKFELTEGGTYYVGGTEAIRVYRVEVTVTKTVELKDYTLDINEEYPEITTKTELEQSGAKEGGTDKFFTLYYKNEGSGNPSRIDIDSGDSLMDFSDGYSSNKSINLQGTAKVTSGKDGKPSAAVKFTTTSAATVKVYWRSSSGSGRTVAILDSAEQKLFTGEDSVDGNTHHIDKFELTEGGTYYVGGTEAIRLYRIVVTTVDDSSGNNGPRADWDSVAAPVIKSIDYSDKGVTNELKVTVDGVIGHDGGDKLTLTVLDSEGNEVAESNKELRGDSHEFGITLNESGVYTFKAVLARTETDADGNPVTKTKAAEKNEEFNFILILEAVTVQEVSNKGKVTDADGNTSGVVEVSWFKVKEASEYRVTVTDKETGAATTEAPYSVAPDKTRLRISEKLEIDKTYVFSVCAVRQGTGPDNGEELSTPGTMEAIVTGTEITAWNADSWNKTIYGDNISTKENDMGFRNPTADENGNLTSVEVYATNGKGKIVPASCQDGIALYYTSINPQTTNFKFTADIHVNEWNLSNGQEGFGLFAGDSVAENGYSDFFWNNSYMAVATKVQYKWNTVKGKVSTIASEDTNSIELKLGLESLERTGVTKANQGEYEANSTAAMEKYKFKSTAKPLDIQVKDGSYDNLIGNYGSKTTTTSDIPNLITDLRMSIELNATGYFISYTPITVKDGVATVTGETVTNKHYNRDILSQIESDRVYIGVFAARNTDIKYSNITLETSDYDENEVPEIRPVEYEDPIFSVSSSSTANSADYTLIYEANWKGILSVRDETGKLLASTTINGMPEECAKAEVPVQLSVGANNFQLTFDPDRDFDPYGGEPVTRLSSYAAKVDTFTVTYKQYGKEANALYVSPKGSALGNGTKINPLDIYTAIKYSQPGQSIYLMEGTYNLTSTVRINRGINGTADKMIYMIPDPESQTRPVLDFSGACAGMVLAGDYWYFAGFDVTRSSDGQKGIQVSGSHNVLDNINTYKNGNTGIQISRLLNSDLYPDWPAYNTILNCTSYLNADGGYEDADGFAAKLTVGDGNVFDGCVAAYNADDGWDFYAKAETGSIGNVTIKNSIAYKNGYVLRADNGVGELAWYGEPGYDNIVEVDAGNGNGFKMGGSSISGKHELINSLAFRNKAKGFDSNSGPDIRVYNSITYNNESYNVAFYSSKSATEFMADGLISYRKEGLKVEITNGDGSKETLDSTDKSEKFEDRIGTKSSTKASSIVDSQKSCEKDIFGNTNYFWNCLTGESEPGADFYKKYTTWTEKDAPAKSDTVVSDDWFVSTDFDAWFDTYARPIDSIGADRNPDGSINMHGFLELSAAGKQHVANAGMGSSEPSKSDFPDAEETDGNIEQGNATDETGGGPTSDDLAQMPGSKDSVNVGLWFAIVDKNLVEYTGKAVKPEVHVYSGTTLLRKGKDYTITYKNNLNAYVGAYLDDNSSDEYKELAGKYSSVAANKRPTIIVRGKGSYTKQGKDVTFDIYPVSLESDLMNRVGISDMAVAAKASVKIKPVVTFINKKLSDTKDFGIEVYRYEDKTNEDGTVTSERVVKSDNNYSQAGSYLIDVTGKGNFTGTRTINLNVVDGSDKNILASSFKLASKIPDKYRRGYENPTVGLEVPLAVTLTDAELQIKDGKGTALKPYKLNEETNEYEGHYTVSYKNNIEIGTASVIVTGVPAAGYYGSKEFKFRIIAPTLQSMLKTGDVMFINTAASANEAISSVNRVTGEITLAEGKTLSAYQVNASGYDYMGKAIDLVKDYDLGVALKRNDGDGDKWYLLTAGKDYKLSYRNNTRAGNATAVFGGIGNYRGNITLKFKVNVFNLNDSKNLTPQGDSDTSALGGTFEVKNEPVPKLDENGNVITDENGNAVYETDENGNIKYEPKPVMFTSYNGSGEYTGYTTQVSYTKGGARPTVSLRINGNLLKQGRDYTVTYRNNTKVTGTKGAKTPTIIIKGRNGLKGTITATYSICAKSLNASENKITITAQDVGIATRSKTVSGGYEGRYNTRIVVKDEKGRTLSAGTDYDRNIKYEVVDNTTLQTLQKETGVDTEGNPTYEPWVLAPNEKVTIKGADDYLTIKVTVTAKEGSFYDDPEEYEETYMEEVKDADGNPVTDAEGNPVLEEKTRIVTKHREISEYYRVAYAKNNIRSAKTTINYLEANKTENNIPFEATKSFFYYYEDGITLNEQLLTVQLKDSNGQLKTLKWNEDFEVVGGSYSGNNKKGTAKLTIQGKGQYFGTRVVTFKIAAKDFVWWQK